jgi:hypothetical protein
LVATLSAFLSLELEDEPPSVELLSEAEPDELSDDDLSDDESSALPPTFDDDPPFL